MLPTGEVRDGSAVSGPHSFINHSCNPTAVVTTSESDSERLIVVATRDLRAAAVITFDYSWTALKGQPRTRCMCGESECTGYIEKEVVLGSRGVVKESIYKPGMAAQALREGQAERARAPIRQAAERLVQAQVEEQSTVSLRDQIHEMLADADEDSVAGSERLYQGLIQLVGGQTGRRSGRKPHSREKVRAHETVSDTGSAGSEVVCEEPEVSMAHRPKAARALQLSTPVTTAVYNTPRTPYQDGGVITAARAITPGVHRRERTSAKTPREAKGTKGIPSLAAQVDTAEGTMDVKEWLTLFVEHGARYEWSDDEYRIWVSKGLEGVERAREWNRSNGQAYPEWSEWMDAFLTEFAEAPAVRLRAREAWNELQQRADEPSSLYFDRFEKVRRRAIKEGGVSLAAEEHEAMYHLVKGLGETLRQQVGPPVKGETMRDLQTRIAHAENFKASRAKPSATRSTRVGAVKAEPAQEDKKKLTAKTVCHRCWEGELHHYQDCPRHNADKPATEGQACFACDETGHRAFGCPKKGQLHCDECSSKDHVTARHGKSSVKSARG